MAKQPWLLRTALGVLALLVILAAAAALSLRLYLTHSTHLQVMVQDWLRVELGQEIQLQQVSAEWLGWDLELNLQGLHIKDADAGPDAYIQSLKLTASLLPALYTGSVDLRRISVDGLDLTVLRDASGQITVSGLTLPEGLDDRQSSAQPAFLRLNHLRLTNTRITWQGPRLAAPLVMEHVTLNLRNAGDRHQIDATLQLQNEQQNSLHFALDAQGDLLNNQWQGRVYLKTRSVPVVDIFNLLPPQPLLNVESGLADVELWGDWRQQGLQQVSGLFSVSALEADIQQRRQPFDRMESHLSLRRQGPRWHASLNKLRVRTHDGNWMAGQLELLDDSSDAQLPRISASIDSLPLAESDAFSAALVDEEHPARQLLHALRGKGHLRDLRLDYYPGADPGQGLHLVADLDAVGFAAQEAYPGLRPLFGQLRINGKHGSASLHGYSSVLQMPGWFAQDLVFEQIHSELAWQIDDDGWRLNIPQLHIENPDLSLHLVGDIRQSGVEASPRIYLQAELLDADITAIPRYLPARLMHGDAVEWLQQAFLAGRIPKARLLLHGALQEFPFDHGQGRFYIQAQARGVDLHYAPGWPELRDIDGEVIFNGRSMQIETQQAHVFQTRLQNVQLHAGDLAADVPLLVVNGVARGDASGGLRFLQESPLRESFGRHLQGTRIKGPMDVDLTLHIPLSDEPNSVNGTVHFRNNAVTVAHMGLDLRNVTGPLTFNEQSMQAKALRARLSGQPVKVTLRNVSTSKGAVVRIGVAGQLTRETLKNHIQQRTGDHQGSPGWLSYLTGETDWLATIDVREPEAGQPASPPVLLIQSDLRGMGLELPSPLGKTAQQSRPLSIRTLLDDSDDTELHISYGDQVTGTLELHQQDGETRLTRGTVYLGSARGGLVNESGLTIVGALQKFSLSEWLAVLQDESDNTERPLKTTSGLYVGKVNLSAQQFELLGLWLKDMTLRARHAPDGSWVATLEAPDISGRVLMPADESAAPMTLKLQHLALAIDDSNPVQSDIDPHDLPPLLFFCDSLELNQIPLGRVEVITQTTPLGLRIESASISNQDLKVEASGNWTYVDQRHISSFQIRMNSSDVGKMLSNLGYEKAAMKGGSADFEIDASWAGSPMDFAMDILNGTARFSARDGALVDVDPGAAGRIFGLISLQALPRRLKLDFSDLFDAGFTYDSIDGTFTVDNGDAYTNDLTMTSPSARVDMAGRVGLATQDYDQIVTVTPELTTTLPLAGAVAGGPVGAAIGAAAALLAKTIFKTHVDRAITYQYQVTGKWDDPVVEPIVNEDQEETSDDAFAE